MVYLTAESKMRSLGEQYSFNSQLTGDLNGKRVFLVDPSYQQKNHFKAGVGPGMFNGLGTVVFMMASLFAAVVATTAVAIATRAWKPTLITAGIGIGFNLLILEGLSSKS